MSFQGRELPPPRITDNMIRYRPLLPPVRTVVPLLPASNQAGEQPRERLPSLKDLDLYLRGRGVEPESGLSFRPVIGEVKLFHRNTELDIYPLDGKRHLMQVIQNETDAVFRRRTNGGRELVYNLSVVQPPIRARACGSGDKAGSDRRPVDPPPVVRLQISHNGVDITSTYESQFMLYVGLEHARPYAKAGPVPTTCYAVLKGQSVAGAAYLSKPINAAYFIFSDLSVQHEGFYRLKFQLFEQPRDYNDWTPDRAKRFDISRQDRDAPDESCAMELMTYVYSKPFTVYSAKKFPGLSKSTELSKVIAEQGCRVRIRRDIRQRKSDKKKDSVSTGMPSHDGETSTHLQTPSQYSSHLVHDQYRPSSYDMRRPSIDSQVSTPHQYVSSRQPSYSSYSALQSPTTAGPGYYATQQEHYQPQRSSYATEPEEMYPGHNTQQRPHPPMHMPVPQSPHHAPQAPAPTAASHASSSAPRTPSLSYNGTKLPGIEALLNQQPPFPPRPEGLYQTTALSGGKRAFTESREERDNPVQERVRPRLMPTSRAGKSGPSTYVPPVVERAPLVSGTDAIEADDEDDESDDEGTDHDILNFYRRANGQRNRISHGPMSFAMS